MQKKQQGILPGQVFAGDMTAAGQGTAIRSDEIKTLDRQLFAQKSI